MRTLIGGNEAPDPGSENQASGTGSPSWSARLPRSTDERRDQAPTEQEQGAETQVCAAQAV